MVNKIIPDDLRNSSSPNKNQDYFLITLNDLNPSQRYDMQFAWVYEDKSISDWSATYYTSATSEPTPIKPRFLSADLVGGNGFIKITWSGLDQDNVILKGIKQVNIWIKGGNYGNTYVNLGQYFTAPGTKTISLPAGLYTFKIQAETYLGTLSPFSDERSARSIKSPTSPTSITGTWVKDDGTTKTDTLKVGFTFDSTLDNDDNSNLLADHFVIYLTSNDKTTSFISPINKNSSNQAFYLSASQNKAAFGLFKNSFTISILVIDTFGTESVLVDQESLEYGTPLDTPTITLVAGVLLYTVAYNSQTDKPFDQIYIEEVESESSTAPTTGWGQVAQGVQNPLTVQTLNANKRWVRAKFYDSNGGSTSYSSAASITPTPAVTADNIGPSNVTSVTTSQGIDTSGFLGFNAYIDVSWPQVTGGGIRGYRIRFSNDNGTTYSYVDSPGNGTTYRLGGLAVGSTYKIAVATYDEFNNLSSQFVTTSDVTISGTPASALTVTAGQMQLGYGVGGNAANRGIYLDSDNYWYLNSSDSARLKVGGSNSNYLLWDGLSFAVDGNITARGGYFRGNVSIQSGGSLFSGVLSEGSIIGAGYILNDTGLSFSYGSTEMTTIEAATGKLTTKSANIGGWGVTATTINKNGITLTAPVSDLAKPSIIVNKGAYYLGIQTPSPSSPQDTDIVLWAGQSSTGSGANFRVSADGKLYANGAQVTGDIVVTSGDTYNFIQDIKTTADGKNTVYYQDAKPTLGPFTKGDIWVDTNDNNKMYVYGTSDFVLAQDSAAAKATADAALPATSFNSGAIVTQLNTSINKDTTPRLDAGIYGQVIVGGALISSNSSIVSPTSIGEANTTAGTAINLNNGSISTPGFRLTSGGDAYFKGSIESGSTIKGATFETTNYAAGGNGVKISTVSNGESISFAYNGSEIGSLSSKQIGSITTFSMTSSLGGNNLWMRAAGSFLESSARIALTAGGSGSFTSTEGMTISGSALTMTAVSGIASINAFTSLRVTVGATLGLWIRETTATLTGGTNSLYIDDDSATLTKSNAASSNGLRNISFTATTSTPSGGDPGDIVLVYA